MESTIYLENMIVLQPTYGMDTTHYCRLKVVPYTSGKIWSARVIFLFSWQRIYPLINIKILTNSNQQTQSY